MLCCTGSRRSVSWCESTLHVLLHGRVCADTTASTTLRGVEQVCIVYAYQWSKQAQVSRASPFGSERDRCALYFCPGFAAAFPPLDIAVNLVYNHICIVSVVRIIAAPCVPGHRYYQHTHRAVGSTAAMATRGLLELLTGQVAAPAAHFTWNILPATCHLPPADQRTTIHPSPTSLHAGQRPPRLCPLWAVLLLFSECNGSCLPSTRLGTRVFGSQGERG